MRRVAALLSTAAVVLWTVGLVAQAKPNFAGKWTLVPAEGAAAGGGGRGGGRGGGGGGASCGMECTITQDASTLKIERMAGENMISSTFKLDGSDSSNSMMGRGGEATTVVSKAMWDGAKLTITTPGQNGETKAVLSLEGGNLVISTTRPGRGGGDPTTTTQTYKKS